ncbi:MAG: pilus assembly protein [Gemmatimonadetes bacterium]|nr:pilus assembly protein [Gemmatimonadota bacterium]NNM07445.1 pilus assembly protein [Gemmatimonadota bacterium]
MRASCRFHRSFGRGDSGQALVEFALVVPILLLLLLGIVEFARAWNIYEVLTDAAREGARTAVVDDPDYQEESAVKNVVFNAGATAGITIDLNKITFPLGFGGPRGETTTVRIEYEHELKWVTLLWKVATGDEVVTMTTEFSMRNE